MVRASCKCGVTLTAPSGVANAQCPVCHSNVDFTSKIPKVQNQVQAIRQYNNYRPAQSNYSHARPQSPQLIQVSSNKKKRAVLIGISYLGQKNGVKGSVNDVRMMTYFLIHRFGFSPQSVLILTEEEKDMGRIPTRRNIQMAMNWLTKGCQAGDSLVFFYSGHGSRVIDHSGDEADGFDESLCPVDYKTEGKILDDEVNEAIVRPLPRGAKLHAIVDTCRSGTLLDLPFMCKMNRQSNYRWEDHRTSKAYKGTTGGIAICFSACDDHETSLDITHVSGDTTTGAMTYSFIQSVEHEGGMTYGRLLQSLRAKIRETEKRLFGPNVVPPSPQVPQLTSSQKFDIHTKSFML